MNKFYILILFICIFPFNAFAGFLDLSRDANGWTVFSPSPNDATHVVYVSATDGDNANCQAYVASDGVWSVSGDPMQPNTTGTTPVPCEDYETAVGKVTSGNPDWVLFKRGETFTPTPSSTGVIHSPPSGKDVDEPFVIGAYGSSGSIPTIEVPSGHRAIWITSTTRYLAIVNIDFYAKFRNPNDGGSLQDGDVGIYVYYSAGAGKTLDYFLIEGCKFRWFENNTIQAEDNSINIEFRRNLFSDDYEVDTHSQGIYTSRVDNIKFYQNILIHNGWYQQQLDGQNGSADGRATTFNHNIYWASSDNVDIEENLIVDGSSSGIKLTGEHEPTSTIIKNNFLLGNEIPISIGSNYQTEDCTGSGTPYDCCTGNQTGCEYRFQSVEISKNVVSHAGRLNPTNREFAWGMWITGTSSATIYKNLLLEPDSVVTGQQQGLSTNSDKFKDTTWSENIVFNWDGEGLRIADNSGSSNINFTNNKIQLPDVTSDWIVYENYNGTSEWSFSGNKYYGDSQTYYANGTTKSSTADWNAWTGGSDTWQQVSFPDDTRDIEGYMTHIGKSPATADNFVTLLRAQDRYNWDHDLEADKINDWIRAGFGMYDGSLRKIGSGSTGKVGGGAGFTLD